jgi:hypothetical protein
MTMSYSNDPVLNRRLALLATKGIEVPKPPGVEPPLYVPLWRDWEEFEVIQSYVPIWDYEGPQDDTSRLAWSPEGIRRYYPVNNRGEINHVLVENIRRSRGNINDPEYVKTLKALVQEHLRLILDTEKFEDDLYKLLQRERDKKYP